MNTVTSGKRPYAEITKSLDSLHISGFKIYPGAFKIPQLILNEVIERSKRAGAIFNHNKNARNDKRRRQRRRSTQITPVR